MNLGTEQEHISRVHFGSENPHFHDVRGELMSACQTLPTGMIESCHIITTDLSSQTNIRQSCANFLAAQQPAGVLICSLYTSFEGRYSVWCLDHHTSIERLSDFTRTVQKPSRN